MFDGGATGVGVIQRQGEGAFTGFGQLTVTLDFSQQRNVMPVGVECPASGFQRHLTGSIKRFAILQRTAIKGNSRICRTQVGIARYLQRPGGDGRSAAVGVVAREDEGTEIAFIQATGTTDNAVDSRGVVGAVYCAIANANQGVGRIGGNGFAAHAITIGGELRAANDDVAFAVIDGHVACFTLEDGKRGIGKRCVQRAFRR